MKQDQQFTLSPDYFFPITSADVLPLDATEAMPLPDVRFIGIGAQVVYERRNDLGQVVMTTPPTVIGVNYRTQQVHLFVSPRLRFWVSVTSVSLATNGAANQAAFAA